MPLTDEDVQHVALLCRIALDSDEIQVLRGQLSNILDQFVILKQLSTEDVPATAHSLSLSSVMRPDVALDSFPIDEILANAPDRDEDHFRVRSVLEDL